MRRRKLDDEWCAEAGSAFAPGFDSPHHRSPGGQETSYPRSAVTYHYHSKGDFPCGLGTFHREKNYPAHVLRICCEQNAGAFHALRFPT